MISRPRLLIRAITILLFTGLSVSASETVVGRYVGTSLVRAADPQSIELSLRLADIVLIEIDEPLFFDAIEVHAELPHAVASRTDLTIAILLYGNLAAHPQNEGPLATSGLRLHFEPFISRTNTRIRIPVQEDPRIRVAATTRPERIPGPDGYPLAVTFLPVGKTFPEYLQDEEIQLRIQPYTRDIGAFRVDLVDRSGETISLSEIDYELRVDGESVIPDERSRVFLASGFRSVEFRPEGYQTVTRTTAVERGRIRPLELVLEPLPARLTISGPRGALVTLNGRLLTGSIGTTIDVEPGPNTLRFQIGDRSVSQDFVAESGRSYQADLSLLLNIFELQESVPDED